MASIRGDRPCPRSTACPRNVARLLRSMDFSLRINCKVISPKNYPRRDDQFRQIAHLRSSPPADTPVICADCRKNELVGSLRNSGVARKGDAKKLLEHDFPFSVSGKAVH